MSAYNFKKQFARDVELGLKRCTIRADRKDGRVETRCSNAALYTGMRTRSCRLLRFVTVRRVRRIKIHCIADGTTNVFLDGRQLTVRAVRALARRDGFSSIAEFRGFFNQQHGAEFSGHLIEW